MSQNSGQPASLAAQAAKLRSILESAVTAISDRGLVEGINPSTERFFGYWASELIGRNVKMLMPEPYRGEHDGYISKRASGMVSSIGSCGLTIRFPSSSLKSTKRIGGG